jgi:hypothetical protein
LVTVDVQGGGHLSIDFRAVDAKDNVTAVDLDGQSVGLLSVGAFGLNGWVCGPRHHGGDCGAAAVGDVKLARLAHQEVTVHLIIGAQV